MEIQGKDIDLYISTVLTPGSEVWKKLICLETLDVNWSRAVNKRQTRCGTKVGLGVLDVQITGTGVADDAPAAGEVSIKEMEGFINGSTQVAVKANHATTSKYFVGGLGYLTAHSETAPSDNTLDFNFTLDLVGTIDLVP